MSDVGRMPGTSEGNSKGGGGGGGVGAMWQELRCSGAAALVMSIVACHHGATRSGSSRCNFRRPAGTGDCA